MRTLMGSTLGLMAAVVLSLAEPAWGQVLISQTRANSGGVTPGDAPGFPVSLYLPGSYKLSGNLTVPDAFTGAIDIRADNVTLDLNGFAILGPTVCSGTPLTCTPTGSVAGVRSQSDIDNVTVVNGSVRGMGSHGVLLGGSFNRVEKIHATSNAAIGIAVGPGSIVTGNTATSNRVYGINAKAGSTVTGNTTSYNGTGGIFAETGSVVTGNTALFNHREGINVGSGSTVSGNTTNSTRTGPGIIAGPGSTVSGNTAGSNGLAGISTSTGSTVTGNTSSSNGIGIVSGLGSSVTRNAARSNIQFGLSLQSNTGYVDNVLTANNGGDANPQVSGGIQMGVNVCGTDPGCP
jgi:hypothetical protein